MVPAPALPLKVKNTFIDIDERFIEEELDSDLGPIVTMMAQRQVTEPVMMCRQTTPLQPPAAAGRPREEAERSIWADQNEGLLESGPMWDRCVTGESWREPTAQEAALEEAAPGPYTVAQGWIATELVSFQLPCIAFDQGAVVAPGALPELQDAPADWGETLTVMMRNLPNKYSQQMLLEEINQTGFAGTYDFLYLPIDPETKANRGYAFINFVGPAQSWAFKNCYEGRQIGHFNSGKVITVMPATLQGFEANHAHYASARVSRGDPSLRPLFLREPSRVCTSRQATTMPTQRRRRGRMSLIDEAAQRATGPPTAEMGFLPAFQLEAPQDAGQKLTICFCPYCGGKAEKDFRFCKFCGKAMPDV